MTKDKFVFFGFLEQFVFKNSCLDLGQRTSWHSNARWLQSQMWPKSVIVLKRLKSSFFFIIIYFSGKILL